MKIGSHFMLLGLDLKMMVITIGQFSYRKSLINAQMLEQDGRWRQRDQNWFQNHWTADIEQNSCYCNTFGLVLVTSSIVPSCTNMRVINEYCCIARKASRHWRGSVSSCTATIQYPFFPVSVNVSQASFQKLRSAGAHNSRSAAMQGIDTTCRTWPPLLPCTPPRVILFWPHTVTLLILKDTQRMFCCPYFI